MSRILWAGAALLAASLLGTAHAQTVMTPAATAPAGLYQTLGEKPGIERLMDDFVNRVLQDRRIAGHFKDANAQNLKASLTDQICQVAGGSCQYKGPDMKTTHEEMDITKTDFHALVEVLQATMDAHGIAFAQQNRLLALLAPMHRDIITKR